MILHLLAALALAPSSPQPPSPAQGVECVYRAAERGDLAAMATMLQPGHSEEDKRTAFLRLATAARSCQQRLGWSDEQAELSARYAASRAAYEAADASLRQRGLGPAIDEVVGKITPEAKAQAITTHSPDPVLPYALPILRRWMDLKLSPAERDAASRLLAVGVAHRLLRDDFEARFGKAVAPPLAAPRGSG
jgi:hypothetical protein